MTDTPTTPSGAAGPGKAAGLRACSTAAGVIAALAIDQRGSLRKALAGAAGKDAASVPDADLSAFKEIVTAALTPSASAVLLDPLYGFPAAAGRAETAGLILAYEKSGYDATDEHRMPTLLPDWSAAALKARGADAVKVLAYYDPDGPSEVNEEKRAFVQRVGDECRDADVAFFLEPVTFSAAGDEPAAKPDRVIRSIREWTLPRYGVDVLKVEVPVAPSWLTADALAGAGRTRVLDAFRRAAEAATRPLAFLSAGVDMDVFVRSLELAGEAGARFAGVLCGRATWKGGVAAYATGGRAALEAWLADEGAANIGRLNAVLEQAATPL